MKLDGYNLVLVDKKVTIKDTGETIEYKAVTLVTPTGMSIEIKPTYKADKRMLKYIASNCEKEDK